MRRELVPYRLSRASRASHFSHWSRELRQAHGSPRPLHRAPSPVPQQPPSPRSPMPLPSSLPLSSRYAVRPIKESRPTPVCVPDNRLSFSLASASLSSLPFAGPVSSRCFPPYTPFVFSSVALGHRGLPASPLRQDAFHPGTASLTRYRMEESLEPVESLFLRDRWRMKREERKSEPELFGRMIKYRLYNDKKVSVWYNMCVIIFVFLFIYLNVMFGALGIFLNFFKRMFDNTICKYLIM